VQSVIFQSAKFQSVICQSCDVDRHFQSCKFQSPCTITACQLQSRQDALRTSSGAGYHDCAAADLGMFSMFGQRGAPQKGAPTKGAAHFCILEKWATPE